MFRITSSACLAATEEVGMSLTLEIELTDEEEARLKHRAATRGKQVEECLHDLIATLPNVHPQGDQGPKAGAKLVQELRANGALGIWKDRADSPELAQELRRRAEKRAGSQCV